MTDEVWMDLIQEEKIQKKRARRKMVANHLLYLPRLLLSLGKTLFLRQKTTSIACHGTIKPMPLSKKSEDVYLDFHIYAIRDRSQEVVDKIEDILIKRQIKE